MSLSPDGCGPATSPGPVLSLLTPDNCALLLIDYQPQMAFATKSIDGQLLVNNAVGLAKTAGVFGIPAVCRFPGGFLIARPLAHCDLRLCGRDACLRIFIVKAHKRFVSQHFIVNLDQDLADAANDRRRDLDLSRSRFDHTRGHSLPIFTERILRADRLQHCPGRSQRAR